LCEKRPEAQHYYQDTKVGQSRAFERAHFVSKRRLRFRGDGFDGGLTIRLARYGREGFCRILALLEGIGNSAHG
jgi:hypothetical protein